MYFKSQNSGSLEDIIYLRCHDEIIITQSPDGSGRQAYSHFAEIMNKDIWMMTLLLCKSCYFVDKDDDVLEVVKVKCSCNGCGVVVGKPVRHFGYIRLYLLWCKSRASLLAIA